MTARSPVTGRFVSTANAPESSDGTFETMTDLPVEIRGVDPADLAQGGHASRLRADNPALVHPDDHGHHNAVLRTAARSTGPMDPTPFLTGLGGHTAPSIQEGDQGSWTNSEPVRGGLRPASRGQGRGRWLPSLRHRS